MKRASGFDCCDENSTRFARDDEDIHGVAFLRFTNIAMDVFAPLSFVVFLDIKQARRWRRRTRGNRHQFSCMLATDAKYAWGEQNMQLDSVKFEGTGPFYLRAVERADASALGNTIQLTLYAQVDELGQTLVKIETQMTSRAAENLGENLLRAANIAAQEIGGYTKL